ncbi:GL26484 [Drosophila persimilis]|uniref:GL26484 n=1 Tax=Drosophila persimilis TaxID=7234 RepID=B4IR07_DROPE|nr:GL26484 [Drosophila persimilis]
MCKKRNDKLSHYLLHLPRKDCRLARWKYLDAPVLASLEDASKRTPQQLLAYAKNISILEDFTVPQTLPRRFIPPLSGQLRPILAYVGSAESRPGQLNLTLCV